MVWKLLPFLGLSVGVMLTAWLTFATGPNVMYQHFTEIGWGVLAIVAVRAIVIATNGLAWAALLPGRHQVPTRVFILLRWIREAVDVTLPVASIGGGLVSTRMLTFWGVAGAMATASLVTDIFLQTSAQAAFAFLGALLLIKVVGPSSTVLSPLLFAAAAAFLVLGAFYLVQRHKGVRTIELAFAALFARIVPQAQKGVAEFQAAVDVIWRRHSHVLIVLLVHSLAWTIGTSEVMLSFYFFGRPVSLAQAVILESMGTTISIAAFFVPGSWGVQEGGYILIGQILGLPPHLCLALSFVKRIPDFLLGLPGLAVWQRIEARHAFTHGI
jgi:putative membrane protein